MEEDERERLERMLEAVTLAGNAGQVREEVAELRQLAMQARAVEATGTEAKLARLEDLLRNEGFFDRPDKRLLVFTEFRDTLDHLVGRLKDWGFAVGSIHGGMKPGSRDEPGTRLHSEQRFREGAIQVLVATEAARYVPFKLAWSKTVSHPPAAPAMEIPGYGTAGPGLPPARDAGRRRPRLRATESSSDRARTRRLAASARPDAVPRRHPAGAADGDRAGRLAYRAFPDRAAAARRRGDRQGGRRPGPGRAGGGRAAGPGGAIAR